MSERARFKKAVPLVSVSYYEKVNGKPLETAYFRGEVLKYAGDVISPEQVAQENVRTVNAEQYLKDKQARDGSNIIAEGVTESILVSNGKDRHAVKHVIDYKNNSEVIAKGFMQMLSPEQQKNLNKKLPEIEKTARQTVMFANEEQKNMMPKFHEMRKARNANGA